MYSTSYIANHANRGSCARNSSEVLWKNSHWLYWHLSPRNCLSQRHFSPLWLRTIRPEIKYKFRQGEIIVGKEALIKALNRAPPRLSQEYVGLKNFSSLRLPLANSASSQSPAVKKSLTSNAAIEETNHKHNWLWMNNNETNNNKNIRLKPRFIMRINKRRKNERRRWSRKMEDGEREREKRRWRVVG